MKGETVKNIQDASNASDGKEINLVIGTKEIFHTCLDYQRKYFRLKADVESLMLMATGKADECIFLSDDDSINIIAENIRKDKNMLEHIKQNKNGLREESTNS